MGKVPRYSLLVARYWEKNMYLASWSGGKDSCLACHKAIQSGYQVSHLVNFISEQYKRVSFHGTEASVIQLQSEAVGIPLAQQATKPEDYEPSFKQAVRNLLPQGIKGMIFGDIYLQEHKQWVERICGELGIKAIEPLWGLRPEDILAEFINSGFEAVVISGKASMIEPEWIGHKVDNDFISYLKTKPIIDPCGEMGEYHTVVLNGPLFKNKIEIKKSKAIEKETPYGLWRFLDIQEYTISE